jgi:hypothetical protein
LSSPSLTYLGRLSYGTYLWHWPVAVVLTYDRRVSPWVLFVVTCVIATGLAALSFHLVERPTRGSRLLDRYRVPVIASGLAISLLVGILVVPAVLERHHGSADLLGSGKGPELLDWKVARNDGVSAPDCLDAPLRRCTIVNGTKKRVLLIGDSYAQMWIPALREVATTESMTLAVATLAGCPWQRGLFYTDLGAFTDVAASIYRRCKREQPDWYERIVPQFKPDIVILAHPPYGAPNYTLPLTFPDGRKLKYGAPGFERELEDVSAATLRSLRAPGGDIVIIEPIPELAPFNPINCLSRGGPASRCEHEVHAEPTSLERYFRNESHPPAMSTLDLDNFVCPRLPICDPIVDNVIVRHDGNGHLTATFARAAAPRIATLLRKAGLLSGP